jgi:hypothetical protein
MNDTAWIPVGELGESFRSEAHTLPETDDLAGRTLTLNFADGRQGQCRFDADGGLLWSGMDADTPVRRVETCIATRIRDGVYFVDFLHGDAPVISTSLVLDMAHGACTMVTARLPTREEASHSPLDRVLSGKELTAVHAQFAHAAIDAPFTIGTPTHPTTPDLIDRRVEYTYSPTERYEHIYLNPSFYTWHCLQGSEQGLADTDRCHHYKIGPQLYLFVWREKIVPTLGVILIDLDKLKTTGKVFGYRGYDFGPVANFAVGAKARLLNVTSRIPA